MGRQPLPTNGINQAWIINMVAIVNRLCLWQQFELFFVLSRSEGARIENSLYRRDLSILDLVP
jgi:hypothetical protein